MMNRHIQELVEQAPYTTVSTEGRLFSQQDLAKFAETVIKECATLADCPNSFKHRSGSKIRKYFGLAS